MDQLVHKELSYKIIGIAFEIDNKLGSGLSEKVYSKAFEELLLQKKIAYERELYCPVYLNGKLIARRFVDFLVDKRVAIELKAGNYRFKDACNQLYEYLKLNDLKLGLIIRFNREGVQIKRIVNLK